MNHRFIEAPDNVYWVQGEQIPRLIRHKNVVFQKGVGRLRYSGNTELENDVRRGLLQHASQIIASVDKVIPLFNIDFYHLWHKTKHTENVPEAFAVAVATAMLEGTLEQYQQPIDNSAA